MLSRDPDIHEFLTWAKRPGSVLRRVCTKDPHFAPRLSALIGVQQSPEHHPEGDAFEHTCQVVDAMAAICDGRGLTGADRGKLVLAAIVHDIGKAATTRWNEDKQKWTAYGHDVSGVPIACDHIISWQVPEEVFPFVLTLVRWHMSHCRPADQWTHKSVAKLLEAIKPCGLKALLLLMEADCRGRGAASSGLPASIDKMVAIAREAGWAGD